MQSVLCLQHRFQSSFYATHRNRLPKLRLTRSALHNHQCGTDSLRFNKTCCLYRRCKHITTLRRPLHAVGDDFLEDEVLDDLDDDDDEELDRDPNNAVVVVDDDDDEDDDGSGVFRARKGKVQLGDDDDEPEVDIAEEEELLEEDDEVDLDSLIAEDFAINERRQKDDALDFLLQFGGPKDEDEEEEIEEEGTVEESTEGMAATVLQERPVRQYRLQELLLKSGYEEAAQIVDDAVVMGVQNDHTKVVAGDVFIVDGATVEERSTAAEAAVASGASALVTSHKLAGLSFDVPIAHVNDGLAAGQKIAAAFYDFPSRQMTTVGFVGSLGKTTTSWLVRGLLEEQGQLTGMLGTLEYAVAEERLDVEGDFWKPDAEDTTLDRDSSSPFMIAPYEGKYVIPDTTPDGLHTQKVLGGMADRGATCAVIEATTEALGHGRCKEVDFDVLVFTNILKEQAEEYEGGAEEYAQVLQRAFESLDNKDRQRAVINVDEPQAAEFLQAARNVPVVTYSLTNKAADVWAEKIKYSVWETETLVRTPYGKLQIIISLLGRHNVYNTLAAVATGLALGVDLRDIVAGIEAVEVIPGRCEIIDEGQAFPVIVDSANTPESLARLLDNVRETGPKQVWLLFGCEGNKVPNIRPYMGEVAHYKADWAFITNHNPRNEAPDDIINDICSGFPEELHRWQGGTFPYMMDFGRIPDHLRFTLGKFHWSYQTAIRKYIIEDRYFAIRCIIGMAQPKDVVIVAGKGAQDYQEYDDDDGNLIKGWFDDRVECRNALSKLGYLYSIRDLDRREIPWTRYPEERETYPLRTGYVPQEFLKMKEARS